MVFCKDAAAVVFIESLIIIVRLLDLTLFKMFAVKYQN
jgi:hypothetical protein